MSCGGFSKREGGVGCILRFYSKLHLPIIACTSILRPSSLYPCNILVLYPGHVRGEKRPGSDCCHLHPFPCACCSLTVIFVGTFTNTSAWSTWKSLRLCSYVCNWLTIKVYKYPAYTYSLVGRWQQARAFMVCSHGLLSWFLCQL